MSADLSEPVIFEAEKSVPINYVIGTRALQRGTKTTKDAHRNPARLCYSHCKPKGPVCDDTFGYAVAAPTDKRGFVMSEFVRHGVSHVGMVSGRMGHTARLAARRIPCHQHLAHPLRVMTRRVASESRYGAKTMTKAIPLVRTAAPIITLAGRRAAPIQSQADTTDPQIIGLHIAAENALAAALHLIRNPSGTTADLERATARACRAATLLKRACAAQTEGAAA